MTVGHTTEVVNGCLSHYRPSTSHRYGHNLGERASRCDVTDVSAQWPCQPRSALQRILPLGLRQLVDAEQGAPPTLAPTSARTSSRPSSLVWAWIRREVGTTSNRTPGATFLPRNSSAAARISSMRPLAREPM